MIKWLKKLFRRKKCKHERWGMGVRVLREMQCLDCGKTKWEQNIDVSFR